MQRRITLGKLTTTRSNYYSARYYNPRISLFLGVDPLVEQTMQPYTYANNNPVRFIDPTGMASEAVNKPTPKEAAAMAAHVYGDKKDNILIGGWKVSNRKFGDKVRLEDQKSGFKSQMYERTVEGRTEYTYATAGTEADWKDVGTDIKQPLGLSAQYSLSASNSREISDQLGDAELTFTGHSLGGGLAALNSNLTGHEAITFNAAGVSKLTKYVNGSRQGDSFGGFTAAFRTEGRISAYIMTTDPLNKLQNGGSGLGLIMPDVNGKIHYVKPTSASSVFNGHSMDNMLREFGVNPNKSAK